EAPVTFVGDEGLEVELRVPRRALKHLIGHRGNTINRLRRQTGAQIEVEEQEEEEEALVQFWGSPAQVCHARAAVQRLVAESAPVAEELRVPWRAVGRIIGRGGETVRGICRSSGARVECLRDHNSKLDPVQVVQLSGTRKEVEAAKRLILEKLSEDAAFRRELALAAAARCPRKQPLGSPREPELRNPDGIPEWRDGPWDVEWAAGLILGQDGNEEPEDGSEELENGNEEPQRNPRLWNAEAKGSPGVTPGTLPGCGGSEEVLLHPPPLPAVPSPDFGFQADEHLDVYVSAAEDPGHFWIQILGNRSLQLDKLTAEMGHFYSSGPAVPPPSVDVGDIVAALYPPHGDWYRARVLGVLDNGHFDLYYVDFGDNGEAPRESLRALRGDFLSLPFQAIECSLAGIVPAGGGWSEPALDAFERLTHCAQWTPLVAQISSYSQSGLCPRPSVRLFADHQGQRLDVGAELIRLGFALPGPPEEQED
ncbi:TDRKH protein, partial [Pitta sordida]|nr:TDRKH protein [Pitta sordida]